MTIMKMFENVPDVIKQYKQWVLWKLDVSNYGKTKVPYQINGFRASTREPRTWTSFKQANIAFQESSHLYNGIGFVFSDQDPFTGIDLDKCIIDGNLTNFAQNNINHFNSYSEVSQSGTGIHIIVEAKLPGSGRKIKGFEVYDNGRFFVVTGNHIESTPRTIEKRQTDIDSLYSDLIENDVNHSSVFRPLSSITLDDQDIIHLATTARNGEKFTKLLIGDFSSYNSYSEADQAFCNIIAFYTQDKDQIDRIFRVSELYREKWDREDYRERTIRKALTGLSARYYGSKKGEFT